MTTENLVPDTPSFYTPMDVDERTDLIAVKRSSNELHQAKRPKVDEKFEQKCEQWSTKVAAIQCKLRTFSEQPFRDDPLR